MIAIKLFFVLIGLHCFQCFKQPALPSEIANNFGPFKAEFSNLQLCNGPKGKDLTKSTATLDKIEDSYILHMNMTFPEKVNVEHVKVEVYKMENNKKSVLWSNKVDEPCKHYALGELFYKYFGISRSCIIEKGEKYYVSNVTDITYSFYGNSFYYGQYLMKGIVFADKGNIFCISLNSQYLKLHE